MTLRRPSPKQRWVLPRWTVTTLLAALFLTGCSGAPKPSQPVTFGRVTGVLQEIGVGHFQKGAPLPGTVTLTAGAGEQYTVRVPNDGRFGLRVPIGTYTADGGSPALRMAVTGAEVECDDLHVVHVETGSTTPITVSCGGL
jgi:hypothetical protein